MKLIAYGLMICMAVAAMVFIYRSGEVPLVVEPVAHEMDRLSSPPPTSSISGGGSVAAEVEEQPRYEDSVDDQPKVIGSEAGEAEVAGLYFNGEPVESGKPLSLYLDQLMPANVKDVDRDGCPLAGSLISIMKQEVVDQQWAFQMELQLRDLRESLGYPRYGKGLSIQCRTNLCQVSRLTPGSDKDQESVKVELGAMIRALSSTHADLALSRRVIIFGSADRNSLIALFLGRKDVPLSAEEPVKCSRY